MSEQPSDTPQETAKFDPDVAPFRQPMVTSIGIVLGFLLAFLANWAAEADAVPVLSDAIDYTIALALFSSAALFTLALYRLLDNRLHANAGERYQGTFRVYILAFLLAFVGLAVALVL